MTGRDSTASEPEDTIIAISTPAGRGALGVVRVSGPLTREFLATHCRSAGKDTPPDFGSRPRTALYCDILDDHGNVIDDGLVSFFPGPRSYTGEDLAELSLHGNPVLLRLLVRAAVSRSGLRPADPGEFTRRGFLNGRMDLTQAEAVKRIIDSRSEYEAMAGRRILTGQVSRLVSRFRSAMISLMAETEAELDFPDEDLTFESREQREARIDELLGEIGEILDRSGSAARVASGFQIALAGIPNAGKSSLLNHILGWDRAIVSPVAGTTRDFLAEEIEVDGVNVRVVDTAGLHESEDLVEKEGMRRSRSEIDRSNMVLHVIDCTLEPYDLPEMSHHGRVLSILNKRDLLTSPDRLRLWREHILAAGDSRTGEQDRDILEVSCTTGEGIDQLRERIRELLFEDPASRDPLLLEERHRFHFDRIAESLRTVKRLWEEGSPDEIVAEELKNALDHAGSITGTVSTEEVLGRIFSLFCIGK